MGLLRWPWHIASLDWRQQAWTPLVKLRLSGSRQSASGMKATSGATINGRRTNESEGCLSSYVFMGGSGTATPAIPRYNFGTLLRPQ